MPLSTNGGVDHIILSQPVIAVPGQVWFLSAYLDVNNTQTGPNTNCSVYFQTNLETLWVYSYALISQHSYVNGSGILKSAATVFQIYASCTGSTDVTVGFKNISWVDFAPSAGSNPILPVPVQVLLNNQFSGGIFAPWITSQTTGRADFSVSSGRGTATFTRISALAPSPANISQAIVAEAGQTYTTTADVYFTIPFGSTTICTAIITAGDQIWTMPAVVASLMTTTQHFSVNQHGTLSQDATSFVLYATCTGNQAASVAFGNVYFTLNS